MLSILVLLVALASPALAEENVVCNGKVYCIGIDTKGSDTIINIESAAKGWFGFGLGPKMTGADIFVAWLNGEKGFIAARESPSRSKIVPSKTITVTQIPFAGKKKADWAKIQASVKVPTEQVGEKLAGKAFIWASSETAPVDPADPDSKIGMHKVFDKFTNDFSAKKA